VPLFGLAKLSDYRVSGFHTAGTLDESLRKYIVPQEHPLDDDDTYTYVYFWDPLRFEEFKAEPDAGGE
jgi:hypothetical protein